MMGKWLLNPRHRLDVVAGLIDGILNALMLAAGRLYINHAVISLELVTKVAIATVSTTFFVFFVAHYAELRAELVHASRELSLTSHGHLAATKLGRQVAFESFVGAAIAAVCGLVGSIIPLLLSMFFQKPPVLSLALTIALLGILGVALARNVVGSALTWSLLLMLGGITITFIGVQLNIVG